MTSAKVRTFPCRRALEARRGMRVVLADGLGEEAAGVDDGIEGGQAVFVPKQLAQADGGAGTGQAAGGAGADAGAFQGQAQAVAVGGRVGAGDDVDVPRAAGAGGQAALHPARERGGEAGGGGGQAESGAAGGGLPGDGLQLAEQGQAAGGGALSQEPGLDIGPGGVGLRPPAGAGALDAQRPGRTEEGLQGLFQGRGGPGIFKRDAQGTGLGVEAPAGHGGRGLGVFLQVLPGLGGGDGSLQADGGGVVPAHLQVGGGEGLLDAATEPAAAHAGVFGGHVGGEGDDIGLLGDGLHDAVQAEGGLAEGKAAVRFVGRIGAAAFGFGGGESLRPAALLCGRAREGPGPRGFGIRLHPSRIRRRGR